MSSPIDVEALREARWFAGKHRRIAAVRAVADWGVLSVAEVTYEDDGTSDMYLLLGEGLRWAELLRAGRLDGPSGRIELRASPMLQSLLDGDAEAIPSTDQSNTLVTVGSRLLVKAYRRLAPGVHPEVELNGALAGTRAPVPAFGGSLHWITPDGEDWAIALLQEFVDGAVSGWEEPIEAVAAGLRDGTFDTNPYALAGAAAGALHTALASRLGSSPDAAAPARWHTDALTILDRAVALEPLAAAAESDLRRRLAALSAGESTARADSTGAARSGAPRLTRIHGDLHFAQFLRTPDRTLIVDLEGDPTASLSARRRADTPLRDLAALLRSIDHIGTAASRRAEWRAPDDFIAAARAAALDAYNNATKAPADPALLAALELTSELRELVYAHTVLPEWAYAPQAGLKRLLQQPGPPTTS
jgi:maltokinase